jgi:hypothetical protein
MVTPSNIESRHAHRMATEFPLRRPSLGELAGAIVAASAREMRGRQEVPVWFSREEIAHLSTLAEAEGVDLSQYIRARVFEPRAMDSAAPVRRARHAR